MREVFFKEFLLCSVLKHFDPLPQNVVSLVKLGIFGLQFLDFCMSCEELFLFTFKIKAKIVNRGNMSDSILLSPGLPVSCGSGSGSNTSNYR